MADYLARNRSELFVGSAKVWQESLKTDSGIDVSRSTAQRTCTKAHERAVGDFNAEYRQIRCNFARLEEANPGTHHRMKTQQVKAASGDGERFVCSPSPTGAPD